MQALSNALQQMQDGQVLLQQQLAATQAEQQRQLAASQADAAQAKKEQQEMVAVLTALRAQNDTLVIERRESMAVLSGIPAALAQLGAAKEKPRMLMDSRDLGKPSILNSVETENRFRMWVIKAEDYIAGQFGEKFREALQWAAEHEGDIHELDIDQSYGETADLADHIDDLIDKNSQLYWALRCLTEGTPFQYVDNSPSGNGFEAWRALHRQYDPSTGGRKKVMLNALIRPDRAGYEQLAGALERWKALRVRYERKKDQLGKRTALDESIAMNAIENLVPKELEQHLLMNHARLTSFHFYEQEIRRR